LAQFSYSPVTGTTVEFTDDGIGATTVYWDFNGDGNVDETTEGGASVQYDFGTETVFGVTMIAENGCGSDTTSQNVLVQDVNVEELKNEIGFSVYPNPTSDITTMSITDKQLSVYNIDLLDLKGRKVLQVPAVGVNRQIIETSKLRTGIYVLQVLTSKGIINHRLIKQ
jgi:PKD repeat protein